MATCTQRSIIQLCAANDYFFLLVANVVSLSVSEASGGGAGSAGAFGAQKLRKGMFRTVGQLYKVKVLHNH